MIHRPRRLVVAAALPNEARAADGLSSNAEVLTTSTVPFVAPTVVDEGDFCRMAGEIHHASMS
jgi:hypothetical protein